MRRLPALVQLVDPVQTILGTVSNWQELQHIDNRVTFHVTVDGEVPAALQKGIPEFVDMVVVPHSFAARKARYKARALEYFRRAARLHHDDWVLHLDEETQIDAFAVRACVDFIERTEFDIGMVSQTSGQLQH
jgi:hypothetical protein